MSTTLTPSSDKSLYFDAPIAHFHMSTPAQNSELAKPYGAEPVADSSRESTVVATGASPKAAPDTTRDFATDAQGAESVDDADQVHIHPNGSEGWLPAADADAAASTSPRTGAKLRKSGSVHSRAGGARSSSRASSVHRSGSIGGQSTGRRSIFTNSQGNAVAGSTFINGAGTTGPNASAEADESLHTRAASANDALTPKQKSKIVKAEGVHIRSFVRVLLTLFTQSRMGNAFRRL